MIIICKMHFPLDDIALNKSALIYTGYLRNTQEM